MMGKIVPPTLEPAAKHARASPSRLRNQCVTTPAPRVKTAPLAICVPTAECISHGETQARYDSDSREWEGKK